MDEKRLDWKQYKPIAVPAVDSSASRATTFMTWPEQTFCSKLLFDLLLATGSRLSFMTTSLHKLNFVLQRCRDGSQGKLYA